MLPRVPKLGLTAVIVASLIWVIRSWYEPPVWACEREDRSNSFAPDRNGRGYENDRAAVEAWLPTGGQLYDVDLARLHDALTDTSGPDRYEAERQRIYFGDQIFVELSLSNANGRGWRVVSAWACSPGTVRW